MLSADRITDVLVRELLVEPRRVSEFGSGPPLMYAISRHNIDYVVRCLVLELELDSWVEKFYQKIYEANGGTLNNKEAVKLALNELLSKMKIDGRLK